MTTDLPVKATGLFELAANLSVKATGLVEIAANLPAKATGLVEIAANLSAKATGLVEIVVNLSVKSTGLFETAADLYRDDDRPPGEGRRPVRRWLPTSTESWPTSIERLPNLLRAMCPSL